MMKLVRRWLHAPEIRKLRRQRDKLIEEIAVAKRRHRRVSHLRERLEAITNRMLFLEGRL